MSVEKVSPFNYCTQALSDIQHYWMPAMEGYTDNGRMSVNNLRQVSYHLEKAQKFIIPNGDHLVSGGYPNRAMLQHLHMPYPVTALEYYIKEVHLSKDLFHVSPAKKRISLIFEVSPDDLMGFDHIFRDESFLNYGGWVVIPLWFETLNGINRWTVCHSVALLPRIQTKTPEPRFNDFGELDAEEVKTRKLDLYISLGQLLPELVDTTIRDLGRAWYDNAAYYDCLDEILAFLAFIFAVNCSNVVPTKVNTIKDRVNRHRAEESKPPLFEYRILTVPLKESRKEYPEKDFKASRQSPRFHFRRGHPRILHTGKSVWVVPTTVGTPEKGAVLKDYVLFM